MDILKILREFTNSSDNVSGEIDSAKLKCNDTALKIVHENEGKDNERQVLVLDRDNSKC